jgi:hypothetical protein
MFMLGPQDLWRIPRVQIGFSAGILVREIPSPAGRQTLSVDGG